MTRTVASQRMLAVVVVVACGGAAGGRVRVAADQVSAIRAGRLFDARAGRMLTNQVILLRGDRITDVGANLSIPAGARVIDLSGATVLPGLIDAHVHMYMAGDDPHARAIIGVASALKD